MTEPWTLGAFSRRAMAYPPVGKCHLAPLGLPKCEKDDHRDDDHQYGKPLFFIESVRRAFKNSHMVLIETVAKENLGTVRANCIMRSV